MKRNAPVAKPKAVENTGSAVKLDHASGLVWLAVKEQTDATTYTVAKACRLKSNVAYLILNSLRKAGLITSRKRGGSWFWYVTGTTHIAKAEPQVKPPEPEPDIEALADELVVEALANEEVKKVALRAKVQERAREKLIALGLDPNLLGG